MNDPRRVSLALSAAGVILLLLILIMAKGWWDYLLVALAAAMLVGSYELRRRSRSRTYREVRSRRRSGVDR